ncbi:hypothetical protein PanWU01x14_077440 [Parasponia andersonii]|uniref:Uncharacterized protein n=1 Tax=Parasponia andersonii TaxID=3476 RepID=A0A2P5DBQ1_PARAD|nr:hypothetical protein PanWU01x14_077440 [Parasponia andersonii]
MTHKVFRFKPSMPNSRNNKRTRDAKQIPFSPRISSCSQVDNKLRINTTLNLIVIITTPSSYITIRISCTFLQDFKNVVPNVSKPFVHRKSLPKFLSSQAWTK